MQDRCYCYCGPTLVAINVFKGVKGLFEYSTLEKYSGAAKDANLPHAYAVVEENFQRLFEGGPGKYVNQATVITGESGAGKSFTTNRMLDYLSAIGRPKSEPRPPCFRDPPIKVSDRRQGSGRDFESSSHWHDCGHLSSHEPEGELRCVSRVMQSKRCGCSM